MNEGTETGRPVPAGPLGLIAGNGRFPFLVAAGARKAGRRVVAVAIREEAAPELSSVVDEIHWVGLGQLGRCIEALRGAGAREAVMAGQVQHRQIFSDVVPDLKLMGLLARLAFKNTDSLIGAVADALGREGITLLPSTTFVEDQLAGAGNMTRRGPSREERGDIEYGRRVALVLAGMDLGQTVVVKDRAAVALEAMEGTDETIRAPRSSRWRSRARTCASTCRWWGRGRWRPCGRPARECSPWTWARRCFSTRRTSWREPTGPG